MKSDNMKFADLWLIEYFTKFFIYFFLFSLLFALLNVNDIFIKLGLIIFVLYAFGEKINKFSDKVFSKIVKEVEKYERRKEKIS